MPPAGGTIYLTQHNPSEQNSDRQADDLEDPWFWVLKNFVGEAAARSFLENQFDYRQPGLVDVETDGLKVGNGDGFD